MRLNTLIFLLLMIISCKKPATTSPEVKEAVKDIDGKEVFIRIFKEENILELWTKIDNSEKFKLYKSYEICTWSGSLGPKLKEGDGQSPEGFYTVARNQLKPDSSYHRAFNIGFPNEFDKANGRTGSFIMVHGDCVSIGCYAMTDPIIEEIFYIVESALKKGQTKFSVHIFPFKMNQENMAKHLTNKWFTFWQNLKTGYDLFEQNHIPPTISVKDKIYSYQK
ncbi:MAG: murein L,D-transpeptidase [Lentisphaeraceae bacterium]|nr:murein L,D-transpeptidase [Lentisphaeraceae bacterium]